MADILIKNMELPKEGESCLNLKIYSDGTVLTTGIYNEEIMPTDATAIELPPHGRLIDADRLKADNPQHMNADVPYVTEETVAEIIDYAPTIVEASNGSDN